MKPLPLPPRSLLPILALWLGGCAHSREVTPWFRTSSSKSPCLMAEAGSKGCTETSQAEREENGVWVPFPGFGDRAFAFAGGERVVYDGRLVKRTGGAEPIACESDLRATPDGRELVCVALNGLRTAEPQTTSVRRLDVDGKEIARRLVRLPVRVPDDEPPLGDYVAAKLLGFLPQGLVFSFELIRAADSRATGSAHRCDAFVLEANDAWRALGSLVYRTPDEWKCNFPRPWNELHGWSIDRGIVALDSEEEPDP